MKCQQVILAAYGGGMSDEVTIDINKNKKMEINLNNTDNNDYVRGYKHGKMAGLTVENERAHAVIHKLEQAGMIHKQYHDLNGDNPAANHLFNIISEAIIILKKSQTLMTPQERINIEAEAYADATNSAYANDFNGYVAGATAEYNRNEAERLKFAQQNELLENLEGRIICAEVLFDVLLAAKQHVQDKRMRHSIDNALQQWNGSLYK